LLAFEYGKGFTGFLIPWACLMDQEVFPNKKASVMQDQRKTFAQALGNTCDIPLSQLPNPILRETWLLSGLMRQITWLILRIARPIYMVGLFYLRGINLSHTLI